MAGLYESDILLWSDQQADLLRRLSRGERVNESLDWENLVEEIESVGRGFVTSVESLLTIALQHLLLAYGTSRPGPIPHWLIETRAALLTARKRFTPGMRQRVDLADCWESARGIAEAKLVANDMYGTPLPEACPFALDDLLDRRADPDVLLNVLRGSVA